MQRGTVHETGEEPTKVFCLMSAGPCFVFFAAGTNSVNQRFDAAALMTGWVTTVIIKVDVL